MIADTVSAGTDYDVSVVLSGNKAQLSVDGVVKGSYVYGDSVTDGSVGLGTKNAVTRFDDLAVRQTGAILPYLEDFGDGHADFLAVAAGTWQINTAGRYKATAAVGDSAISLLQTDAALPSVFDITALVTGNTAASGQVTNGLIIFDYQGPTDFKYAGAFFGSNRWRIGHYDGSMNTVASATQSITTGTDYDLKVSVNGTAVDLLVDGASKVSHDFGASLSGGQVGVGTNNAVARFDNLGVQAPGGAAPAIGYEHPTSPAPSTTMIDVLSGVAAKSLLIAIASSNSSPLNGAEEGRDQCAAGGAAVRNENDPKRPMWFDFIAGDDRHSPPMTRQSNP